MPPTDVLVAGAGPTGLALANCLLAHGLSVRVVDQAARPATTSRANILYGRGVEVLDRLGALGDLPQRSVQPMALSMYVNGRPALTMRLADFPHVADTRHSALYVSQAAVEGRLRDRLSEQGGAVEWGSRVVDIEQDAEGVTAVLEGGGRLRAGWLVGCDGAHSAVRKLAGIAFPGVPVIEQFLLADLHADWDHDRDSGAVHLHRDGVLMVIPMRSLTGEDDLFRLMANVSAEGDTEPDQGAIVEEFRRLLRERAGVTDIRIREAAWTSVFRIHRRLAGAYRNGRILIAGDAAHIHSPVGGQGMNTGMGDAENLAWKLALAHTGAAGDALLDTYQAERRPLAAEVLRTTTANTTLLVGEDPVRRFLRDRVLFPIARMPAVQRRNAAIASQLLVSYRRGPLARRSWFGGKPRPGDRIPDLTCERPDGGATRLYAVLGSGWALLVRAGGGVVGAVTARLGPHLTVLTRTDGRDDAWLVRPDGHLAWRGDPDDTDDLGDWLDAAFTRGKVST